MIVGVDSRLTSGNVPLEKTLCSSQFLNAKIGQHNSHQETGFAARFQDCQFQIKV